MNSRHSYNTDCSIKNIPNFPNNNYHAPSNISTGRVWIVIITSYVISCLPVSNWNNAPTPFCQGILVHYGRRARKIGRTGATMTRLLNDILLFSCMAAFAVGIVLAAARLFI
jgi:hypothetical protein